MNAEVSFEIEPGKVVKYSIAPDFTVWEIRKTGWRKLAPESEVRKMILWRLRESHASISA